MYQVIHFWINKLKLFISLRLSLLVYVFISLLVYVLLELKSLT